MDEHLADIELLATLILVQFQRELNFAALCELRDVEVERRAWDRHDVDSFDQLVGRIDWHLILIEFLLGYVSSVVTFEDGKLVGGPRLRHHAVLIDDGKVDGIELEVKRVGLGIPKI